MERLDVLVRQARDQTGNQQYTSTQGIKQREFVRYANDAQMRIYNKMLMERSSLFMKESFIDVESNEAHYDLPTDIFLKHNVLKVDYSPNGDARLYSPLDMRTPRQEVTAPGYPDCYFLRQGELILSPIPMQSAAAGLRLNYQYTLPTLDLRRATVTRVDELAPTLPAVTSWTNSAMQSFSGGGMLSCNYVNGLFIATGGINAIAQTSPDCITWTLRTTQLTSGSVQAADYGLGVYVLCGVGGISTSTDGATWTLRSNFNSQTANAIAVGNGVIVVAGGSSRIETSVNGTTYTAQTLAHNTVFGGCLKYSAEQNRFVAVGNAGIIYSDDGLAWQAATGGAAEIGNSLNYGGGKWIATYQNGAVRISDDGKTWTTPTTGIPSENVWSSMYGEGQWFIGSVSGVWRSTDCVTWTQVAANEGYRMWYLDGRFYYVQSSFSVYNIYDSADGVTWRAIALSTNSSVNGNGFAFVSGNQFYFVSGAQRSLIATLGTSSTTQFTFALENITDESEEDLTGGWVDRVTLVDSEGVQLAGNLRVTEFDEDTGLLAVTYSGTPPIDDSTTGYLCFGANSSTHSQLPDVAERYLTEYMSFRIQMRDSNSESVDQSSVLRTLEEEIIDSIANLEEDLPNISILDFSMLNYDQDL